MIWMMLLALCSEPGGTEIAVLGGLGLSDYDMTSLLPGEIDFGRQAGASCFEVRLGHEFSRGVSLGFGMGLDLAPFEWRAESDSSSRSERVEEGHVDVFADWSPELRPVHPFARLGVTLQWGTLFRSYIHGDYLYSDTDAIQTAPGVVAGAGFRLPVSGSARILFEADYRMVFRDEFGGWQVDEVRGMNSWRFLLGLGVGL
jgi:hypothetical protein